jgi:ankyrin repeat protein
MAYWMLKKQSEASEANALELNYTGLREAVLTNDMIHVKKCVDSGLDVNHLYEHNRTILFYSMTGECMKFLLERGANPHYKTSQNLTPLHSLAFNGCGNIDAIKLLLDKGVDINEVETTTNRTAAHWTVIGRNRNILRELTIRKADLSIKDSKGKIPLDYLPPSRNCCTLQ